MPLQSWDSPFWLHCWFDCSVINDKTTENRWQARIVIPACHQIQFQKSLWITWNSLAPKRRTWADFSHFEIRTPEARLVPELQSPLSIHHLHKKILHFIDLSKIRTAVNLNLENTVIYTAELLSVYKFSAGYCRGRRKLYNSSGITRYFLVSREALPTAMASWHKRTIFICLYLRNVNFLQVPHTGGYPGGSIGAIV